MRKWADETTRTPKKGSVTTSPGGTRPAAVAGTGGRYGGSRKTVTAWSFLVISFATVS